MSYWTQCIKENAKEGVPIYLVGNKVDLESLRKVKQEEAVRVAEENDIPYYETSAKENINAEECFCDIIEQVINIKYPNDQDFEL